MNSELDLDGLSIKESETIFEGKRMKAVYPKYNLHERLPFIKYFRLDSGWKRRKLKKKFIIIEESIEIM